MVSRDRDRAAGFPRVAARQTRSPSVRLTLRGGGCRRKRPLRLLEAAVSRGASKRSKRPRAPVRKTCRHRIAVESPQSDCTLEKGREVPQAPVILIVH